MSEPQCKRISPTPTDNATHVWCVTVTNLTPNAAIVVTALDPYGVSDLFADENGKLYLWLPDGDYTFVAGNAGYTATVDGAATTAVANGLVAPLFATDGTALVFDGTALAIKITNAKSGIWYALYRVNTLGETWELLRSVHATTDGDRCLHGHRRDSTIPLLQGEGQHHSAPAIGWCWRNKR